MRVTKLTTLAAALFLAGSMGSAIAGGVVGGSVSGGATAGGVDAGAKAAGDLGGTLGAPTVEGSGSASGATSVKPNQPAGKAKVDGAAKSELPGAVDPAGKPGVDTGGLNPGASVGGGLGGTLGR